MATGKLAEVEQDAMRITEKRFKDHFEEQEYLQSKREEKAAEDKRSATVSAPEQVEPVEENESSKKGQK